MKQFNKLDLGSVQVHKKVLAEIISSAIDEIDGVSLIHKHIGRKLFELFGQKQFPGIDIKVDENQDVSLEVQVIVRYGMNIPDIARHVQDTIKLAIEKTVNINMKVINVNIQGIERGQK
jgi:uncharacterized alkaline shock family protein YloU